MECTLRGIFQEHFEEYARRHRVPAYVHRAAYWIARCRTAELGGHVRRCPEGHVERAFYNSCHQRVCPQCQALEVERWLERARARLLACAHHHLIFTIPHELNALWCWNRAAMAKLLFGVVRAVLFELLGDSRYLGATPAFLAALHTWGRSLALHPHVHVLAADGGLSADGAWVTPRRSHFLPARVLMLVFRGKFLAALREAIERRGLRIPADTSRERLSSLLNRLGRKKWNVHIRARYAHGAGVAAYLARYLKGGPLKNTQLLGADEGRVSFRYRPHRDEEDGGAEPIVMTLAPEAFLARYLQHVPPPRLQAVRGYGLYGSRAGERLDRARAALGQAPAEAPQVLRVEDFLARFRHTATDSRCPRCGSLLFYVPLIAHGPAPPRLLH
ncbi:MAG: IS91 family transposase [Burkholderiales bacterium]